MSNFNDSNMRKLPIFGETTGPALHAPDLSDIIALGLEIGFLLFALILFYLKNLPEWGGLIGGTAINFVALILEAMPFMILGALTGGIIEVFVPQEMLNKVLAGRKYKAVFLAGGLGFLFPVCECAIVPVVRRLLGKGVPFPAAIAFLLGGPIVNLIVASSTAVAYRFYWPFVVARLAFGYLIAVGVGLIIGKFFNHQNGLRQGTPLTNSLCNCCGHGHEHTHNTSSLSSKLSSALGHAYDDFFEVGKYLVIGGFIAGFMRTVVSIETFQQLMGSPWLSILLMMSLAVMLNLCSEADAFIAASFRGVLPGSAQMAFMVLGPMLDIKLILMYLSVFSKRVILALSLTTFAAVTISMLFLEYILGGI